MINSRNGQITYHQFRARLYAACVAVLLLFVAGQAWKVNADYQAAIKTTVAQTNNFALAVDAHVVDMIDSMSIPLKAVGDAIARQKQIGNLATSDVKAILTSPLSPNNANYWIIYVDAQGKAVASSNDLPVAGVSYADREYFKVQKNLSNAGLFVGAPFIGRVSKQKLFFISKRVEGEGHSFLGAVVACVDSVTLAKFLQKALYQKTLSITILNDRGKIITRVPLYEQSFGRDISKSDLFHHVAEAANGSYRALSIIDNEFRIYSYHSLEKYPVIITVGMRSPLLVDIMTGDIPEIITGFFVIVLVLFFGSRFALHSFTDIEGYGLWQMELNRQLDGAKNAVEAGEKRARMIADNMPALVAYIDSQQRYQFRNTYYQKVPGIDYESMIGKSMDEVFGPEIYATVKNEVMKALRGESVIFERELKDKFGNPLCLRYQYSPDVNDNGTVAGFYALVTAVTDMKAVQNELKGLARIDSLTGLPNRTALHERIDEALITNARRNIASDGKDEVACLFLDIDHFKKINDTNGHACGDKVLREFGNRLKNCVGQSDMVARLAGDEFVIVLEGLDHLSGTIAVAKKILNEMKVPLETDFGYVKLSTSIGIAISSKFNETADTLLKKADSALYKAKNKGRNIFAVHTEDPAVES